MTRPGIQQPTSVPLEPVMEPSPHSWMRQESQMNSAQQSHSTYPQNAIFIPSSSSDSNSPPSEAVFISPFAAQPRRMPAAPSFRVSGPMQEYNEDGTTQYSAVLEACPNSEPLNDDDVLVGAYYLQHLRPSCANCGTMDTPQWRKGWHSSLLEKEVLLCNACGLKFHKGQFCPYCKFVYGKEHSSQHHQDSSQWLCCSNCGRKTHTACEKRHTGRTPSQFEFYTCVECQRGARTS
jgi:hypothetical protein